MVYCNMSGRSQNGPISVKLVRFASQIEELCNIVIRTGEPERTYFSEIGPFCLPDRGAVLYCNKSWRSQNGTI